MGLNLLSLRYFKKVAELQHMTNAAKELYISQPALSRMIKSLEDDLGVEVFERDGNSIKLNEYGKMLLKRTNIIMQELEDMETELEQMKKMKE